MKRSQISAAKKTKYAMIYRKGSWDKNRSIGSRASCGTMCIIVSLIVGLYIRDATAESPRIPVAEINQAGIHRLMTDKGSPRLIIHMASWCGPCRQELPALIRLYSRYRSRGVEFFGLSFEIGGPSTLQALLDRVKINFPVYFAKEDILRDLKITAIPVLYLIRDGIIVEKIVGARSEAFLDQKLGEFLR